MEFFRRFLGALGILICLAPATSAQASIGTISGSVFTVGGSRLPGVRIELRHQDTGQTFSVISGDRGLYLATNLTSGVYELTAALLGFETKVVSGIELLDESSPLAS